MLLSSILLMGEEQISSADRLSIFSGLTTAAVILNDSSTMVLVLDVRDASMRSGVTNVAFARGGVVGVISFGESFFDFTKTRKKNLKREHHFTK